MNDKIKAAIEDALNTVFHAAIAATITFLAANIPSRFDDIGADWRKWLLPGLVAGAVAGIHALGRILVNVKNAQYNTNLVATSIGGDDPERLIWLTQTVMQSAPQESSAHRKALAYLESKIPTV